MPTRRGARSRSRAKQKGSAPDPTPLPSPFGSSIAVLCVAWFLFVLLNSCITDSEDEIGLLTSDRSTCQHGLVSDHQQCVINNIDLLWNNQEEHVIDKNTEEPSSVSSQEENALLEEHCVEETSVCTTCKQINETVIEGQHVLEENSSASNLESAETDSGEHIKQPLLGDRLTVSDEKMRDHAREGEEFQKLEERFSSLDLEKKASWLLRAEGRAGTMKYFLVGNNENGQCDFRNSKEEVTSQICLVAMPTEIEKNQDSNSNLVDVNSICKMQSKYSDPDIGSEESSALCYYDPRYLSSGCESICNSSSHHWVESTAFFCLCGSSIVEIFSSASLNFPEIQSSVLGTEKSAPPTVELHVEQIEDFACSTSVNGEPVTASSRSQNDSITSGTMETPAVAMQNNELDGEGQLLAVMEPARPIRVPPIGLDEYKRKTILEIQQVLGSKSNAARLQVHHRLESGGGVYNYASAAHGAKVMASNKEAKGASNILEKDKDKYMRNPCSAERKFVTVELSEETLVDTVAIANYEFYSSNLKEFELLGSLSFPTDDWVFLGKFEAENARHLLKFKLNEPKWVRYLRLNMLSHHGSEFFCTLSTLEVYGEDAIERLLEEWKGEEEETRSRFRSASSTLAADEKPGGGASNGENVQVENELSYSVTKENNVEHISVEQIRQPSLGTDAPVSSVGLSTFLKGQEDGQDDNGKLITPENVANVRPPGDSILKILMQKVKSLEFNQSLFDRYLEDMNLKYSDMFNDLDQELDVLGERLRNQTVSLLSLAKRLHELNMTLGFERRALESTLAIQAEMFLSELETLRSRIDRAETRELVALTLALLIMTTSGILYSLYRCLFLMGLWRSKRDQTSYGRTLMGLFVVCGCITLILSV